MHVHGMKVKKNLGNTSSNNIQNRLFNKIQEQSCEYFINIFHHALCRLVENYAL